MSLMGTSRTLRVAPPAHYRVKIESFSLLLETDLKKYESAVFDVAGFKWRLILYPNGHTKRGGKNHVSLFLTTVGTESLETNWSASINFKMFVFDHIEAQYLTIQEADGKVWHFDDSKYEWGYPQLLSKKDLDDPNTGYLVEDRFIFGVEVSLVNYTGKSETLTLIRNPENSTYTWPITNFDDKKREVLTSDVFTVAEYKWQIILYPKGFQSSKGKDLSVYLKFCDSTSLRHGRKIFADFKLRIINHFNKKNHALRDEHWFSSTSDRCGFKDHTPLSDLADMSKGYVKDDKIVIEAKIFSATLIKEI